MIKIQQKNIKKENKKIKNKLLEAIINQNKTENNKFRMKTIILNKLAITMN